jgi:hypothetical protein
MALGFVADDEVALSDKEHESFAHLVLIVAKIDAACSSFFREEKRKKSNRMFLLESPSEEAASGAIFAHPDLRGLSW